VEDSGEILQLNAATTLRVLESTQERLEVEASYEAGGSPPPNHLHPDQDEHFEVLEGAMQVRLDNAEPRPLTAGEELDIPRGTPHTMWNESGSVTRVRWVTSPAGRTEEWFRTLDAFHNRSEEGEVDPQEFVRALEEFADVFRLVLG
jgi:mannose-6-phosphate isomerase-like protein (cupin superfamily)